MSNFTFLSSQANLTVNKTLHHCAPQVPSWVLQSFCNHDYTGVIVPLIYCCPKIFSVLESEKDQTWPCLSVCMFACLSVWLFAFLPHCLPICQPAYINLSVYVSLCLFVHSFSHYCFIDFLLILFRNDVVNHCKK